MRRGRVLTTFVLSLLITLTTFETIETKALITSVNTPPRLTFSVISDIHLRSGKNDRGHPYEDIYAENKFANALKDLHRVNPMQNALVINGDLTVTGTKGDYNCMNLILYQSPHPASLLFSIGNHEFYSAFRDNTGKENIRTLRSFPNGVSEKQCIQSFLTKTGMPNIYFDKWVQGYHFIVLGSEQSRITSRLNYDNPILSNSQLDWLDTQLQQDRDSNKPVFIFLHQPIPHTAAGYPVIYKRNTIELERILKRYPQIIVFSGHSHRTLYEQTQLTTIQQDGFTMFNDSAVRNPVNRHGNPIGDSEGLYVEVYKDRVIVNGRDFTHAKWINKCIVPIIH